MADNERINYDPQVFKAFESNNQPLRQEAAPLPPTEKIIGRYQGKLSPIRTFESDASELIEQQKHSLYSIQQAEKDRTRNENASTAKTKQVFRDGSGRNSVLLLISAFFFVVGLGAIMYYMLLRDQQDVPPEAQIQSLLPSQSEVTVQSGSRTGDVSTALAAYAKSSTVSGNNIENIVITIDGDRANTTQVLQGMSGQVPPALLRAISSDKYMIGAAHRNDLGLFFVAELESYDNAFANILRWETLGLTDLFKGVTVKAVAAPATIAATSTTATSSASVATSTSSRATSTAPAVATTTPVQASTPLQFRDALIQNRDVRLVRNANGEALVVYGFYNKEYLVIASDESAFADAIGLIRNTQTQR